MDANLVRSSSPRLEPHPAEPSGTRRVRRNHKVLFNGPLGDRWASFGEKINTRHFLAVGTVSSDGAFDSPRGRFELAPNERKVLFAHAPLLELSRELLIGHIALRDDHRPGSIFVQPVNDPGATLATDALKIRTVVQKRVDQRAAAPARGGMHHHSGCLIDNDTVLILVQNV